MPIYNIKYKREKISDTDPLPLATSKMAVDYLKKNCYDKDEMWREKMYAVFVNARNVPLGHILVSIGGSNSTGIDKRLIVKGALDSMAQGVIIAHNHPSGDPKPGHADIEETQKLKKALDVFGINLLDHIILGDKNAYSFTDEVMLKS